MNGFNRSYMYRSTETEKKGRKVKNQRGDACKCFPPFVKFHYHNCPAVMTPCPIHGNFLHHTEKEEKVEREQNVIVSFHPSTKTERLLQPIKTLLAHCNSETKINFQYYSPENSTSKESVKAQNNQTAYENLKKSLNNNMFVEKTKSFVANKTNKVKKLRNCFHSPCNSIAQKTRSQTSIKEKINQILREEAKQTKNVFYNLVPEIPPDDKKYEPTSKLFSSTKGGFNHSDFLSSEKLDSDFITVTQQDKNNTIHHKIFEIKHRKGLNDIPFVGFPKQPTQLVYSTVNVTGGAVNETADYKYERYDKKRVNYERSTREDVEETGKSIELCSSEKTNRSMASSSSSGSVYITPFIFVPKGMEDSDTEMMSKLRRIDMTDEGVQVEDSCICKPKPETPKETKTPPSSKKSLVLIPSRERTAVEEPKCKTVIIQTDSFLYEERVCRSSRIVVHDYDPDSATKMEEIYTGNENAVIKRNYDDDSYRQSKRSIVSRRTPDSAQYTRTTEIQTGSGYREVLITARCYSGMRDKTSQTDDLWNVQVSVKTFDSRANKSQASELYTTGPQVSEKGIQTASFRSARSAEFIELNSPNVTYVIKPFEEQDSDQTIDKLAKTWWGKSRSDSDLYERSKCVCCKVDPENPNLPSNLSKTDGNKSPGKAVSRALSGAPSVAENYSKAGNVTLRTRETVERFSDSKQTSTREEELSAAVSDLSELKKIIQEFFEKGNLSSKKTCECDKSVTKAAKIDKETMTDPASLAAKPEQKALRNLIDRAVQTVPEVQTLDGERENRNAFVQTSQEKNDIQVQTSTAGMKNDKVVQTDFEVLLGETEQEKAYDQNVKLRRTVLVDPENQTKTFFVCSVCGREMKNSANAQTSTSRSFSPNNALQNSERQPKPKPVDADYIETYEVKLRTKKVQKNPESSKKSIVSSTQTSERVDERHPKIYGDSQRGVNSQNSRIPIPYPSTYVRFRNNETLVQKNTEVFFPDWARKNCQTEASQSHVATTYRDCICETVGPSTSKGQKQSVSPDDSTSSKAKGTKPQPKADAPRRDEMEASGSGRKSAPGGQSTGNRQKHNLDYVYPVLVTPFRPKEFMKTWKSMENALSDIPSSDDSKSQSSKQKRSCERDLEAAAAGKKIKVDVKQPSTEYLPDLSDFLRQGHLGDIKVWPSNFMLCQPKMPEDERNSTGTDEQTAKKQSRHFENSLENNEDFPLESEHFSDSNNTPTENSFFGDEEEDEVGQTAVEEQPFDVFSRKTPNLRPRRHSVVTLNSSLFPDDMATSKSLNAFWCFLNSKKNRRRRRKNSK